MEEMPSQDLSKIHSEITQAVNQRFLITAGVITAFALIGKNIIIVESELLPSASGVVEHIDIVSNVASYGAYILVVWLLFKQSIKIREIIRTYATYLIVSNSTKWERDWVKFRKLSKAKKLPIRRSFAKSDIVAHGAIFFGISLAALACGLYLLFSLYGYKLENILSYYGGLTEDKERFVYLVLLALITLNIGLIIYIKFRNSKPAYKECDMEKAWCKVLDKNYLGLCEKT